jgi:hypothetical protein
MKDLFFENSKSVLVDRLPELKEIYEADLEPRSKMQKLRSKLQVMSDSKWTIIEEMLIEIEVELRTQLVMEAIDTLPTIPKRLDRLREEIDERFSDNPELAEILKHSIPVEINVRRWTRRPDWKEEVDKRMRDDNLFSYENRHKMIQAVFNQGVKGNAKFAEMYLKMSGDIGKTQEKDPVESTFEKITKSLNKQQ